ncbi:hypothetical protein GUJ93_ZPchr0003g17590 [Zizania palustris]|uniref:Uncharacterized protein n=1 Tax=Zizania palustris TaxID=103762 RepID=A0A8J5STJ2_ZIZPA|nr:hypothetical protein GUJ93_ZPchr0003g17590 [Zizania palustris]
MILLAVGPANCLLQNTTPANVTVGPAHGKPPPATESCWSLPHVITANGFPSQNVPPFALGRVHTRKKGMKTFRCSWPKEASHALLGTVFVRNDGVVDR